MRIDGRFNGPPDSAHGGAACGVFAATVDPRAATVRLLAPPPLDTDLTTSRAAGVVTVSGPEGTVAEVCDAPPRTAKPLPRLDVDDLARARAMWDREIERRGHAFPTCFGCGHGRPLGDGLELYAGVVPDLGVSAAWWVPDDSIASDGLVDDWAVWAAVDCPSGGAVIPFLDEAQLMLLGQLSVWIEASPKVGKSYQVIGRPLGRDGRRLTSEVGVVADSGEQLALGRAVWITLEDHHYS